MYIRIFSPNELKHFDEVSWVQINMWWLFLPARSINSGAKRCEKTCNNAIHWLHTVHTMFPKRLIEVGHLSSSRTETPKLEWCKALDTGLVQVTVVITGTNLQLQSRSFSAEMKVWWPPDVSHGQPQNASTWEEIRLFHRLICDDVTDVQMLQII